MSIEFSCSQCGQNLRVSEEAAGKRAKCPKCGNVNQIPSSAPAPIDEGLGNIDVSSLPEIAPPQKPVSSGGGSPFGEQAANPYSSPQVGYQGVVGGAKPGGGRILNVPVDIGSIVNYAVEVWQQNLGLLVGATVVIMGISMMISYGLMGVVAVLDQAGQRELGMAINLVGSFASQAVQIFLGIGLTQMMLRMARRQRVEFSELFNGGPRFLPVLGVSILFGLALLFGLILLIIPAIIMGLMWWPCYFLVVDDKAPVMDSFGVARTITQGNLGTTFLCWLVGAGITILGFLACCVGLIFAYPLAGLIYVVAYLMMSGQIPLQPGSAASRMV